MNHGSTQSGRLVVQPRPRIRKLIEKVLGIQCFTCGESIPPDKRPLVDFDHVACPRLGAGSR
jgi:hypothetical protein